MQTATRRNTKYASAISASLTKLQHATNAQLLSALRKSYPELSATTVHRVTQRLYEDGSIAKAPKAADGAVRYDANTQTHDHFLCVPCDDLRDITLPTTCRTLIQCKLEDCSISGPLTVSGACKSCKDSLQRIA